jgi:hypothetical protein
MAEFISIQVEGEERLDKALRGFSGDIDRSIGDVARPLSDVVYSMVRAQYASHGRRGPTGKPWTRKQSTIDRYTAMNRRGFSVINEPGRRTDTAFIAQSTRGGPHGIYDVQPNSLTVGDDLGYTRIRQDQGFKAYDPTSSDIKEFARVIVGGLRGKIIDRGFDYVQRESEFAF